MHGVSDEEDIANPNEAPADIGLFEDEEPIPQENVVPEEAPLEIDPVLLMNQQDTTEFILHAERQREMEAQEDPMGELNRLILFVYAIC